ncbi:putative oxidoreductase yteT [Diplocarpon rosae]|nr:putative oxidoreductase yteT [Diplocarpon rosae]
MKRYALVGLGGRSSFFYSALAQDFQSTSLLVGLCDTNQTRMNVANENLAALSYPSAPIPTYKAQDFEKMVRETRADEVIITTMDRTHDRYIIQALELGCDTDPFALHLAEHEQLRRMYLAAEHEDSYYRDQSVFGDGISIEDTMGVLVRYASGAILTYSLTAYAPWEGFRVVFNGTGGRLELDVVEQSYVNSGGEQGAEGALEKCTLTLRPLFEKPREVEMESGLGGHGGGDPVLLNDLFGEKVDEDRFGRAADHLDGARSILTGIAANRSLRTERVVMVKDVLDLKY